MQTKRNIQINTQVARERIKEKDGWGGRIQREREKHKEKKRKKERDK